MKYLNFRASEILLISALILQFSIEDGKSQVSDSTKQALVRQAEFPTGEAGLTDFIASCIGGKGSHISKSQGTVRVRVVIDSSGKVKNPEVIQRVDENADKEAIRVVNLLPDWVPAFENGERIESKREIDVLFRRGNSDKEEHGFPVKVISLKGDTTKGYTRLKLFTNFRTKLTVEDESGNKTSYKPKDIKGFVLRGYFYKSVHMNERPCGSCEDDIFLGEIGTGPVNIYEHYYCKTTPGLLGPQSKCLFKYYLKRDTSETYFDFYKKGDDLTIVTQDIGYYNFCNFFKDDEALYNYLKKESDEGRKDFRAIVAKYNKYLIEQRLKEGKN